VLDAGPLVISEFMALNDSTLFDEDGDASDWIEIHNPSGDPVDLDGWYLTDDAADLAEWRFPPQTLAPGGYVLVFASGKDRADPADELHANFRLADEGEYLAVVRPGGTAVSHAYAPQYPPQRADVSYGTDDALATFAVAEEARLAYKVPAPEDAALAAAWTDPGFDDAGWNGYRRRSRVLITEVGTGDPDYVEIQNLSGERVDTAGWVVVVNDSLSGDINAMHSLWHLPDTMAAEQILYRSDDAEDEQHYWGEELFWRTRGVGWVMVVDDAKEVADFVVWGYSRAAVQSLSVEIDGRPVAVGGAWIGPEVVAAGSPTTWLQRLGGSDHDTATDWAFAEPQSKGAANPGLTVPFTTDVAVGMGFDVDSSGLADAIQVDVATPMHGVNASFWARIPCTLEDPRRIDKLHLRMRYNDGFIAYLNGRKIAEANAPDLPQWNSAATAARSVEDSLQPLQIDLADDLDALRPGENLLAIHGLNSAAAEGGFLVSPELVYAGRRYFGNPTPGKANASGFVDFVKDTKFSVDRGMYDAPFDVAITTATPGATIIYTLDGSQPTPDHGAVYTGPIHVDRTTTLRAAAFKEDLEPTNVDTQTYIFLDQILRQPDVAPPGAHWDTAMDPQVVGDATQTYSAAEGLVDLPVLSIVMDDVDLFGSTGIYQNPEGRGDAWIRPGSVEFFYPDDYGGYRAGDGFGERVGVRIAGIYSRRMSNPKHSFRLSFQERFGNSKLEFPLFEGSPVERFDNLVVINGHNQSWATGVANALYLRDQVSRDLQQLEPGHAHVNGMFVNLYLNGLYWGQYNLAERPDDNFAAENFGGDKDDYDVFKGVRHGETSQAMMVKGTRDAWSTMFAVAERDMSDPASYAEIQQYVDIDQLIDYNIGIIYTGDRDGPTGIVAGQSTPKNFYGQRRRDASGRFRFFPWDAEFTFERTDTDVSDRLGSENPARLHMKLRANAEYRLRFADRVHKWFFNDGPLTPDRVAERFARRAAEIDRSIVAESARWGDSKREPPYRRDVEWVAELARVMNSIIPARSDVVLEQFRDDGLYPQTAAPEFYVNSLRQHGGPVDEGDLLAMPAATGTVYYTLDGSDPRLAGGVSPSARRYDSDPIPLTESRVVKARAIDGGQFSALSEAEFLVGGRPIPVALRLTELNYHPYDSTTEGFDDPELFEFVELQNTGQQTIDLTGVRFTDGIEFTFAAESEGPTVLITEIGTSTPDYVEIQNVAASTIDTAGWVVAFNDAEQNSVNAVEPVLWNLPESMDAADVLYRTDDEADHYFGGDVFWRTAASGWVMIVDAAGDVVDFVVWGYTTEEVALLDVTLGEFQATAGSSWSGPSVLPHDGAPSLILRQGNADRDNAADWSFGTSGSKGSTNSLLTVPFSASPIELAPGEYVVLVKDLDAFAARYGNGVRVAGRYERSLSNSGERVTLVDRFGRTIADFEYDNGGRWPGRADGKGATLERVDPQPAADDDLNRPESWRSSVAFGGTPGRGPAAETGVIINEVLTHTDAPLADAIELLNTTAAPIDVGGWFLSDAWGLGTGAPEDDYRKFRIPENTTIPAGGYVVFREGHYEGNALRYAEDEFGDPAAGGFALSGAEGDDVWLLEADDVGNLTRFADHVDFPAAAAGESLGRWPNTSGGLYPMLEPTLGRANGRPRIGPVLISEVMYNPAAGGLEFVELLNPSSVAVPMFDPQRPANTWRLEGVDFDFPPGVEIAPGQVILVVPVTPQAFRATVDVPADVPILGPYGGALNNAGENLRLLRPDEPPQNAPTLVPMLTVDRIDYRPTAPWPVEADGEGDSLHRAGMGLGGTYETSWTAAPSTPGTEDVAALVRPEVVGRHVFYNHSDFDGNDASPGPADDGAIAQNKHALLPGQAATSDNYTNFSMGIVGVMVDVAYLPPDFVPAPTDFVLHVGNRKAPNAWSEAPAPSGVAVRPGGGVGGSDRVTLIWPDHAIRQQWLRVTVPAERFGLAADDVFYFGSAVAEAGNSPSDAQVTATDLLLARNNPRNFLDPAAIDFAYDYNRDRRVNATDVLLARNNQTNFLSALRLIDLSGPESAGPESASAEPAQFLE